MTSSRKPSYLPRLLKRLFWSILLVNLAVGLLWRPVVSTMSYVTALSGTCVNVFEGETQPTIPTVPTQPSEPSEPTSPTQPGGSEEPTPGTGDSFALWPLMTGSLLALVGIGVTCIWEKRSGIQQSNSRKRPDNLRKGDRKS